MSDVKPAETALEISPIDINISPEGKVEIINPQLAERIKAALSAEGKEQRAVAGNNTNYAACGNNYKCGVAKAAEETPGSLQIRIR